MQNEKTNQDRAKKIKLLMLDIDGVFTDGRIYFGNYGDEIKSFNVLDGFGVLLARRAGIKVVIITAKGSKIVKKRAKEMSIDGLYLNSTDKRKVYEKVLKKFKVTPEEACFLGDDLLDTPVLKRVGLAVAVPNAVDEAKANSHMVTTKSGGHGAVREICDFLIKSQGKWSEVTRKYLQ